MKWYDCPKCGKKEPSPDGSAYCGSCEEKYQKEREAMGDFRTESEFFDWVARINE